MRIAAGIPVARLLADYEASCARDRELPAPPGQDTPARRNMSGRAEPVTLRWILVHLIGETARHVLGQVTASWAYTTAIPDGNSAHADVTSYTYTRPGRPRPSRITTGTP